MHVAMVVGARPPERCGVGDYTDRLVRELSAAGIHVRVICPERWRLGALRREIRDARPDVVHIQYPSIGYGASLVPHLLSCTSRNVVVTLHEVSQIHLLRRLSLYLFWLTARRVIFTNHPDRRCALRLAPWLRARSTVVPVGTNLAPATGPPGAKDLDEIVYFGLIRRKKGLEEVVALAEGIRDEGLPFAVRIVGSPDRYHQDYFDDMRRRTRELPVIWQPGLPPEEIAAVLSRSKVGYLPFPDGASDRRTSIIALLAHGLATITTKGPATDAEMEAALLIADDPQQALRDVCRLMNNDGFRRQQAERGRAFGQRYDWHHIVAQHQKLYRRMLER